MSDTEKYLLKKLSEPGFHSGDDLGQELGISRVAVSKHMAQLRKKGLPLISVAGKGYRLEENIDLLDSELIREQIASSVRDRLVDIHIHQELTSTNEWLLQQEFQLDKAKLCLTESQPGGRGRRDRQWHSSAYRNLLYSISWRFASWPNSLPSASLLAGLVVSEALEICGVSDIKIKWPNDIYLKGKKLGGLLVSAKGEASGACDLVIGVGINHHVLDSDAEAIDQDWIDLRSEQHSIDRNKLAALITEGFIDLLPAFEQKGFAPFCDAWNRRCIFLDQRVRLFNSATNSSVSNSSENKDTEELIGICRGVDNEGVLQIEQKDGSTVAVRDADLSMRPLDT